jgi:hypothetical protein
LRERVEVRGNEANSNPGARRFPELPNFGSPSRLSREFSNLIMKKSAHPIFGALFFAC